MSNMAMTYIYRVTFREAHCPFIRKSIIMCWWWLMKMKKNVCNHQLVEICFFFWNMHRSLDKCLYGFIFTVSNRISYGCFWSFVFFILFQLVSRVRFKCAISGTIITTNCTIKYITLRKKCWRTLRRQMG